MVFMEFLKDGQPKLRVEERGGHDYWWKWQITTWIGTAGKFVPHTEVEVLYETGGFFLSYLSLGGLDFVWLVGFGFLVGFFVLLFVCLFFVLF